MIILDVRMPGLGGLEAVERIKTFAPEVPVIFFAIDCELYRRDPRGCLAEAWIEKREEFTELKQAVAQLLTRAANTSDAKEQIFNELQEDARSSADRK